MSDRGPAPVKRPIEVVIEPRQETFAHFIKELWQYRHLVYYFSGNFLRARYRGTILGWVWVIIQPLVPALVSTVLFGIFLKVPSDGSPYVIFAMSGLCVWGLFTSTLAMITRSLAKTSRLITKIYFPRILVPVGSLAQPLVQFSVNLLVLIGISAYYASTGRFSFQPGMRLLCAPLFFFLALFFAFGIGLWTSVLNSQARDVRFTLPYVLQLWAAATPVVYPLSVVPEAWRPVLMLNPMTLVVEGFRWSFLGQGRFGMNYTLWALGVIVAVFILGLRFFQSHQTRFVDNL